MIGMLLIIDNNENMSKLFACDSQFVNAGDYSLIEALEKIKEHRTAKRIYFPLELKFKHKYRQHFDGFEFLKHIRLTPELEDLQFTPILLGYTYPLENILRNPESTILCAPGTQLFNMKNIHQINKSSFFESTEVPSKETIKPYILFTDSDDAKSEHDRRNEEGPLKLERELNGISKSDIGLDLWQKKLLFLQTETKANEQTNVSDADFKATIKGKRILYLDDEADKWERPLRKLFEGADIDVKNDYDEIVIYFEELQKEQDKLRSSYTEIDRQLLQKFFASGKNQEFVLKNSEAVGIKTKLAALLNYDLILLDMRLDKIADSNKPTNFISGVQILNKVKKINPFIPVVMFTASNKVESYKIVTDNGAYDFWIKNVSSALDLKNKAVNLLRNELQGKRLGNLKDVYAKLLMIQSRVSIYNYYADKQKTSIDTEALSDLDRERIDDSLWYFVRFIQRYMLNSIDNYDIEELWKMTGDTIQIRVPAIYGLTEGAVKRIDNGKNRKIDIKEFDYRWNRNYFAHSVVDDEKRNYSLDPYDRNRAIEYINHTIDFLLDYR
jgi:CheY-like chemotaxis protein